jgi:hypothetical protein
MTDQKEAAATVLSWRVLAMSVIAVIAASGLAALLIPQVSAAAAIRGGAFALGGMLLARLATWWFLRSKKR